MSARGKLHCGTGRRPRGKGGASCLSRGGRIAGAPPAVDVVPADVLANRIGELRERLAGVRLRMRLAAIEEAGIVAALKAAEGQEVQ